MADLIAENVSVRAPKAALERELSHIEKDLASVKRDGLSTKVLELTSEFYSHLKELDIKDFEALRMTSDQYLEEIEANIESIKVAD